MRPCAVSKPPQSVHGSPGASSEVHWFHPSLAHDWRTTATLAVLSKTTSYTGGLAARAVATKMPKPVTLRSSGFEQKLGAHTRAGAVAALLRQ
jgi:hypothetical protein